MTNNDISKDAIRGLYAWLRNVTPGTSGPTIAVIEALCAERDAAVTRAEMAEKENANLRLAFPKCAVCGKPTYSNGLTGYGPHCEAEALRARVAALEAVLQRVKKEAEDIGVGLYDYQFDAALFADIEAALSATPAPETCNDSLQVGAVKASLTTAAPATQAAADVIADEFVVIDHLENEHDFCARDEIDETVECFISGYRDQANMDREWSDAVESISVCRVIARVRLVPTGTPNEDGEIAYDAKLLRLDRARTGSGEKE